MKENIHDLSEFSFAKQIVEEIPKIMIELEKSQVNLYKFNHFTNVADVLYAINDAKTMLEIHYQVYKEIYEKKGQKS